MKEYPFSVHSKQEEHSVGLSRKEWIDNAFGPSRDSNNTVWYKNVELKWKYPPPSSIISASP